MLREIFTTDQNADNLYKGYASQRGCCPGEATTECKYSFTIPDASVITGITYKGADGVNRVETLTPNLSIGTAGAMAVVKALKALIEQDGHYEGDDNKEVPTYRYTDSGTDTIVDFFGECEIVSIQRTSGGDLTPTVTCTKVGMCNYFYAWPGSASSSTFQVNGVDATLAALTLAGNTAANVVSAIEGAANFPATATVTVVETATAFEITIYAQGGTSFYLGGVKFTQLDCRVDYV